MPLPGGNANRTDVQGEAWDGGVLWEGEACVWTLFLWFLPLGYMWEFFAVVSEVLQATVSPGLVSIVSWSVITNCGGKYGNTAGRTQHTSHLLHLQCHFFVNVCK